MADGAYGRMSPRQRRFWWVVVLLLALGVGVVSVWHAVTRTAVGRNWLLTRALDAANGVFDGRGALRVRSLNTLSAAGLNATGVELVDSAGVTIARVDSVFATISWRALLSKVILLDSVALYGTTLDLRQDSPGAPWNIAYVIMGDSGEAELNGRPGFGDDVRITRLVLSKARINTSAPWEPHPVFTGAARDSVIAVRDSLHDLVATGDGRWFERRQVGVDRAVAAEVVITDPLGRPSSLHLDSLSGSVSDPPVAIRSAAGRMWWNGDSLWLDMPGVTLPNSAGAVAGTIAWNEPGALRFDIRIDADAGLSDLGWIWDVLPAEGRGTAQVRMRTLEDPDDLDFTLTNLEISTGGSVISGDVAVTVMPADLLLHGVDLRFSPMRSDLMRRLSYGAIPEGVKGSLSGRLLAQAGGPLTAFRVDQVQARFVDESGGVGGSAHPVSSVEASGIVAIGVTPGARNLRVRELRMDLRLLRPFMPDSLPVDGILEGDLNVAAVDLSHADIRDLALNWTDVAGNRSALHGSLASRYGISDPEVTANLVFAPLSLPALARLDTTLGVLPRLAARISAYGPLSALRWKAQAEALRENAAVPAIDDSLLRWLAPLSASGVAALDKNGWTVNGEALLSDFDLRVWSARSDLPETAIAGTLGFTATSVPDSSLVQETDAAIVNSPDPLLSQSQSQSQLQSQSSSRSRSRPRSRVSGRIEASLTQSQNIDRPAVDLNAVVALDSAKLSVDSLLLHMGGIGVDVRGALALDSLKVDTLVVSMSSDSLHAARPAFLRLARSLTGVDSSLSQSLMDIASDTLSGDLTLSGLLMGSLARANASVALGGRDLQVGSVKADRVFGSLSAENVFARPSFEGAATLDEVTGIGGLRLQSVVGMVTDASLENGRLLLDVGTDADAQLVMRGAYDVKGSAATVTVDSLTLSYDDMNWGIVKPIVLVNDSLRLRLEPAELRNTAGGVLTASADVPVEGGVIGKLRLERFPVGEVAALLAGATVVDGTLSGEADLSGTRAAPLLSWQFNADSIGMGGLRLPQIVTDGSYADQRLRAQAVMRDSLGGALRVTGRLPVDLRIAPVDKRLLSDEVEGLVVADSLRLEALQLDLDGIERLRGVLSGSFNLNGTLDNPDVSGRLQIADAGAAVVALGIAPTGGQAVLVASGDSLVLQSLRVQSGRSAGNELLASGVLRFPSDTQAVVDLRINASNLVLSRQRDGTDLDLSGTARVRGPLVHPIVSASLNVPRATIVVDPLGARAALDLSSDAVRELLGADEVPVAESAAQSLSAFGSSVTVENTRIDLGADVWVETPEARVNLGGGLNVAMHEERLVLDGEITANRGQYRLELGPVVRGFSIDSGKVRFFPNPELMPALDISATNNVRVAGGGEVPVLLHIGGNYAQPELTLSSSDPLYTRAPESEIISLLVFGAPTFALDGQSQSTVQAVTGLLLPSVGGAVEGALLRILPGGFNTIQVSTAGNESQASLNPTSLLDNLNLSISAGKQLDERTYLRLNTGLCRGSTAASARGSELWAGIAVEYRISKSWLAQLGVDPGSTPCTRLGSTDFPRMQLGFDLFRDWIF